SQSRPKPKLCLFRHRSRWNRRLPELGAARATCSPVLDDLLVELGRLDIGLDAELTREHFATVMKLGQRGAPIAGSVVEPHQRSVKALLQPADRHRTARTVDRLGPGADRRVRLDQLGQHAEPALLPALVLQLQPPSVALTVTDAEAFQKCAAVE